MAHETAVWKSPQALTLTRFDNKGQIQWAESIPTALPSDRLEKFVTYCLASISISQAFLDPFDSIGNPSSQRPSKRSPFTVSCNDGVGIVAIQSSKDPLHWYAIIGPKNPSPTDDYIFGNTLLANLEHIAHVLMRHAASNCEDPLQCLFKSMCRNLSSDQGWGVARQVSQALRNSLVNLPEQTQVPESRSNLQTVSSITEAPYFRQYNNAFDNAIAEVWGSSHCAFFLLSPDLLVEYVHNDNHAVASSLLWYYENILNLGNRKHLHHFSELSLCGMVRFCYKRSGWILLGQTLSNERRPSSRTNVLRDAAYAFISFVSDWKSSSLPDKHGLLSGLTHER